MKITGKLIIAQYDRKRPSFSGREGNEVVNPRIYIMTVAT